MRSQSTLLKFPAAAPAEASCNPDVAAIWSEHCTHSLRAFRLQNDAPAKTGAQANNISLVVTKGAEDLGQALWVAWIDWSKSIGQYVPLDPQRKPQWMPASFYPRKEKATEFSSSIVVAWNTGVQLVKLRRDREAIALDMVHLYKLCVHSLDRMQVCARGFEGFAPGACELCGSIEGLGLLMCCTCCLLDMHVWVHTTPRISTA